LCLLGNERNGNGRKQGKTSSSVGQKGSDHERAQKK
jgi:hypothetical protein